MKHDMYTLIIYTQCISGIFTSCSPCSLQVVITGSRLWSWVLLLCIALSSSPSGYCTQFAALRGEIPQKGPIAVNTDLASPDHNTPCFLIKLVSWFFVCPRIDHHDDDFPADHGVKTGPSTHPPGIHIQLCAELLFFVSIIPSLTLQRNTWVCRRSN
ncbi:hypothetical protein EDD36DRAFT_307345 [Exophiala viscosa]|uniref:Uncharacterized protein n=1 Tax=Exophiala viscosa TaxID=2486360 RepID=A0AAN6DT10_9EURO|nr:hypothetical protein EDD36DRAFT_307345 [Exophiala viscosa]